MYCDQKFKISQELPIYRLTFIGAKIEVSRTSPAAMQLAIAVESGESTVLQLRYAHVPYWLCPNVWCL